MKPVEAPVDMEPLPVITEEDRPAKPVAHLRSRDKSDMSEALDRPVKETMAPRPKKEYKFPPINLLARGENGKAGNDTEDMAATARRLEETLETFGVRVKVTDYSKGPAVTRYELHPEQGVKVSRILSLADDIKLNLAASDIRIEAPIPGKMAVGIEVPNKNSSAVHLRELLDNNDFKNFPSNLAFAVGKDIGGQLVVTDIAKMPHVLIAGATGSGKSVCINTLIMSILYKAHPDDVKMIMIDPKVVELNVYNGIPHLMIPVVTDPKKASAALAWGVAEMTERYKKFADAGVRDLKGYNQKAESGSMDDDGQPIKKMPQIVIIVDELADLMMVASKEVEESICRLAQLARAAGIHLIIATQRPSVDVITGLIKANMPSRIAFSVSSGIDSRTILDANGAEKLLGKGDMLFFPQGYSKPARVQGAFVSDKEVSDVVDFIKNQSIANDYGERIEEAILNTSSSGATAVSGGDGEFDTYFAEAGRFVIEKEKGSIGMLQRVFKIGFNRAARIMDQLEEAGVVGPEEGTKPRRILMSMNEFENYLQNR
ncbi:MAG: DNA translocase FtsK [Lachnospiraceae bacterium]|nr:DNA translocase FtsK [Lachnospiraceae bacterium]